MRNLNQFSRRFVLFVVLFVVFCFGSFFFVAAASAVKAPTISERTRLKAEILRLNQPLKCNTDADCESVALGAKPCGGPWTYLVYSTLNPKSKALKKSVANYNKVDQALNEDTQMMSDCNVVASPKPTCTEHVCASEDASRPTKSGVGAIETIMPAASPQGH